MNTTVHRYRLLFHHFLITLVENGWPPVLFSISNKDEAIHQRQFDEALQHCERVIEMRPEFVGAVRIKCSMLAHAGRMDEARKTLERVRELQPEITLDALTKAQPYATEDGMRLFLDGMKKAGLK